jgi:O-antigen ligase
MLDRDLDLQEYLFWSTLVSAILLVVVAHAGIDIMLAYPIVIINTLVLLAFDRLKIHRNHLIALAVLCGFSFLGMRQSSTPINAMLGQVIGIAVMSIYYFSALTNFGVPLSRWMEGYVRLAFYAAVIGLVLWPLGGIFHLMGPRLQSFYAEPSHFVFMTLPAVGYCFNIYLSQRRYGAETLVFFLSYVLADSALGFIGLLLIVIFAFAHRLKGWQVLAGTIAVCALTAGLYFVSANFQLRVRDTATAITSQDLTNTNASTWALLSNFYVVSRSFATHPLTGVGIGGYRYVYDEYISDLTGLDLSNMPELNQEDANSLFLRVAAELGVPGLMVLLAFVIVCARVKGSPYREVRNAIIPYLLVRMGRYGAYISPEVYLFAGFYILNYMQYRKAQAMPETREDNGIYQLSIDGPVI